MNQPNPNSNAGDTPAPPSQALRFARLGIAIGLFVGVGVFGVFAVTELRQHTDPTNKPNTFGAYEGTPGEPPQRMRLPGDLEVDPNSPLSQLGLNSTRQPIAHHPGKIQSFNNAAPYEQAAFREPVIDGTVVEVCTYRMNEGDPEQVYAHYNAQALKRGMKQLHKRPSPATRPGGIYAAWSDDTTRLDLNAWPLPAEPVRPPLRPTTPLKWVVKYSYPVPTDTQ